MDWKLLADTLTLARGLLGLSLVWLGYGPLAADEPAAGLPSAVWVLLLCWAADFLDGRLARLGRRFRHTWIGDRDVYVDVFVSACLGLYLVAAGFVSALLAVLYLLAWAVIFRIVGPNHGYLMLVQGPIYAFFLWVALRQVPQVGLWLFVWVAFVLLVNWSRFIREVVPGFLDDVRRSTRPPQS